MWFLFYTNIGDICSNFNRCVCVFMSNFEETVVISNSRRRTGHLHLSASWDEGPSLQSSIELAATARQAGQQVVIAAIVSGGSARLFMPTYIQSLRDLGNLDKHVVLLNLDTDAHAHCKKVSAFQALRFS
jgi:hypothetical protein